MLVSGRVDFFWVWRNADQETESAQSLSCRAFQHVGMFRRCSKCWQKWVLRLQRRRSLPCCGPLRCPKLRPMQMIVFYLDRAVHMVSHRHMDSHGTWMQACNFKWSMEVGDMGCCFSKLIRPGIPELDHFSAMLAAARAEAPTLLTRHFSHVTSCHCGHWEKCMPRTCQTSLNLHVFGGPIFQFPEWCLFVTYQCDVRQTETSSPFCRLCRLGQEMNGTIKMNSPCVPPKTHARLEGGVLLSPQGLDCLVLSAKV